MQKLGEHSKRKAFAFLVLYRWLTLLNVMVLAWVGAKSSSLLPSILVIIYNIAFTAFVPSIYDKLRSSPPLMMFDLVFCALILHLSGGWASPFYLYCLSPIITSALLFKFKGAMYSASAFSLLYISVLYINGYSVSTIAEAGRLDSLISNFVSFFLVAIFLAYPATLLEQLEDSKREIEIAKLDLDQAHKDLEIAYRFSPLSKRELDVLNLMSEGKTNKYIAEALVLSESTIKTHVSSILRKLDVKTRSEAVAYFYREEIPQEQ